MFKLFLLVRIFNSFKLIEELLKNIFIFKKIMIENTSNQIITLVALIFLLHIFSCFWIWVNYDDKEWVWHNAVHVSVNDGEEEAPPTDYFNSYFDSLYFMTTTMTSVGYGDINAAQKRYLMIYVMLAQFVGILGFSLIKYNVFNVKKQATVNDLVTEVSEDMREYLNNLNRIRTDANIHQDYMDEALEYVANAERYSTRLPLHQNNFWNELSAPL